MVYALMGGRPCSKNKHIINMIQKFVRGLILVSSETRTTTLQPKYYCLHLNDVGVCASMR